MSEKIEVLSAENIGEYFRDLRIKAGMSQTEASEDTLISQQLISLLETRGIRSGTRWDNVAKLLDYYSKKGSPSMFALVYKNGTLVDNFSEMHPIENTLLKQQLQSIMDKLN